MIHLRQDGRFLCDPASLDMLDPEETREPTCPDCLRERERAREAMRVWGAELVEPPAVVHILRGGVAECGAGFPSAWGPRDRWVAFHDAALLGEATCPGCKAVRDGAPLDRALYRALIRTEDTDPAWAPRLGWWTRPAFVTERDVAVLAHAAGILAAAGALEAAAFLAELVQLPGAVGLRDLAEAALDKGDHG